MNYHSFSIDKQNFSFRLRNTRPVSLKTAALLLLLAFAHFTTSGQVNLLENGLTNKITANGSYQDFKIPDVVHNPYIAFIARGGDGGKSYTAKPDGTITHMGKGGQGATIASSFKIGSGDGELRPGSRIRVIVGMAGGSYKGSAGGGGGGGTGVLYLPRGANEHDPANWKILLLAGGGGGGIANPNPTGWSANGRPGQITEAGLVDPQVREWYGFKDNFYYSGVSLFDVFSHNGSGGADVIGGGGGGSSYQTWHQAANGADWGNGLTFSVPEYTSTGIEIDDVIRFGASDQVMGEALNSNQITYPHVGGAGLFQWVNGYLLPVGGRGGYTGSSAVKGGYGAGGGGASNGAGGGGGGYSGGTGGASDPSIVSNPLSFLGDNSAAETAATGGGGGSYVNTSLAVPVLTEKTMNGATDNPVDGYVAYRLLDYTPIAVCKDVTVDINANGQAILSADSIGGGSHSEFEEFDLQLNKSVFTCGDVPTQAVTLSVTGKKIHLTSTCQATVTIAPAKINCVPNVTLLLDDDGYTPSISKEDLFESIAFSSCGELTDFTISPRTEWRCWGTGDNTVTLSAKDPYGHTVSCTSTVTVIDNMPPVAVCKNNTVYLDKNGQVNLTPSVIDGGSYDNCYTSGNTFELSISKDYFGCNALGPHTLTLTITDQVGQTDQCTATVNVLSDALICKSRQVGITSKPTGGAQVDLYNLFSYTDPCGAFSSVGPDERYAGFDCDDIGTHKIPVYARQSGGTVLGQCEITITVVNKITPECNPMSIVKLDDNNQVTVTSADLLTDPACGICPENPDYNNLGNVLDIKVYDWGTIGNLHDNYDTEVTSGITYGLDDVYQDIPDIKVLRVVVKDTRYPNDPIRECRAFLQVHKN